MELSRRELVLADRAKTNADLEELFKFRSGEVSVHEMGVGLDILPRDAKSYRATNSSKMLKFTKWAMRRLPWKFKPRRSKRSM